MDHLGSPQYPPAGAAEKNLRRDNLQEDVMSRERIARWLLGEFWSDPDDDSMSEALRLADELLALFAGEPVGRVHQVDGATLKIHWKSDYEPQKGDSLYLSPVQSEVVAWEVESFNDPNATIVLKNPVLVEHYRTHGKAAHPPGRIGKE